MSNRSNKDSFLIVAKIVLKKSRNLIIFLMTITESFGTLNYTITITNSKNSNYAWGIGLSGKMVNLKTALSVCKEVGTRNDLNNSFL